MDSLLPPAPKSIAGRYQVEGLLGRGGMGAVYRVLDTTRDRRVALKQLRKKHAKRQPELAEMLSREYRTLAQLSHPSVIRVYDYGVSEGGPYYTMELLAGTDLHDNAPMPWRQACRYIRDACSCLALLHSRRLIHRDVSPRNVRCVDGRATLIDFGAMMPMGPAHQIVGTPPLVPPEVLNGQALDGRCDLYALGATLYWALTGHHAYPARTLSALRHVWSERPVAPSSYDPEIPEALDALVSSLLATDVDARPRSAADVLQHLSVIAGIEDDERLRVTHAYLSTPSLTGRDREVSAIRRLLDDAVDGGRGALFLTGESGVGRSRILDVAVVEARLSGAQVLRLQAVEASGGECGVAEALLQRSDEIAPHLGSNRPAGPHVRIVDSPSRHLGDGGRTQLLSRVRAMVRRLTSHGPLAVVVDDVDALDPASQALLATLPTYAKGGLALFLSAHASDVLEPALELLRQESPRCELEPLDAEQTDALLRSVFGDAPGLAAVVGWVHRLSRGNPRATMELAQHLVDSGAARYELGGWVLPARIEAADLPSDWSALTDARLAGLSKDERELSEVLAHGLAYGLSTDALDALTSHGDARRREAAMDGLLAGGILLHVGGRYAFVSTAHRDRLIERADPQHVLSIHARLAAVLRDCGHDAIEVARCLQRAAMAGDAIDVLLQALKGGSRWQTAPGDYAQVLQDAIDACAARGRPPRERFELLCELVKVGEHLGVPNMRQHFAELFVQLRADGGPDAWDSLPDDLEPSDRLSQTFTKLQQRYDALPQSERVLPPFEALRALAMVVRQASAFCSVTMDQPMHEMLPSLEPFASLSPAIRSSVDNTIPASRDLTAGRYEQARAGYQRTLDRLNEPDHAGLDPEFWEWAVGALHFALGHINAGMGIAVALDHADFLEQDASWAVTAWDVRHAYYQRYGNWHQAEVCRNRIERLTLESGRRPQMVDTSARLELDAAAHAGDLMVARRATKRLTHLIGMHPGYAPYEHYAPAVCELLRGNYHAALEHVRRALPMVAAGMHPTWPWIVDCELSALLALERFDEAKTLGMQYLAQAQAADLKIMAHHVTVPLALAEARLGQHGSAIERLDAAIAYREQLGVRGVNLGWAFEQRARVAIWMRDFGTFATAAGRCAQEYGKGRGGSSLMVKYEALRSEAQQAGLGTPSLLPERLTRAGRISTAITQFTETMLGANSFDDRCNRALSLLLKESGAQGGVLYSLAEGEPRRLVSTVPVGEIPADAAAMVVRCRMGTDDDDVTTETVTDGTDSAEVPNWTPVALGHYQGDVFQQSGAAMLSFAQEPEALSLELIEFVGRLLDSGAKTSVEKS